MHIVYISRYCTSKILLINSNVAYICNKKLFAISMELLIINHKLYTHYSTQYTILMAICLVYLN